MKSFYEKQGSQFAYTAVSTLQEPHPHSTAQPNTHIIPFAAQNMQGIISVHNPKLHLEVATLQSFLDDYMKGSKSAKIDYVHDKDVVAELGAKPNNIGFYLPAISKHDFFRTIIVEGALPSKTFSMGKADEKRFYLECRKITSCCCIIFYSIIFCYMESIEGVPNFLSMHPHLLGCAVAS